MNINTVNDLLIRAQTQLHHIESARLDAEILLVCALNTSREQLYSYPDKIVSNDLVANYQSMISSRADNYPVAYLTGAKEFWSIVFQVNQHTLIPRPETELLIETALGLIPSEGELTILDLGAGSGAIAISIAKERPKSMVVAIDISEESLAMARKNAASNIIFNITFKQSDWLSEFTTEVFDVVLCNPPYVDSQDSGFLDGEIRYEPRIALDGGHLGMQCFNTIVPSALKYMRSGAYLVLEHGYNQGDSLRRLLMQNKFKNAKTVCDYAGLERVSYARRP